MGKAEAGSTKWVSNQMKSKGLTRLRWFCQICEVRLPPLLNPQASTTLY